MILYKYLHRYGLKFLSNLKLKLTSPAEVDDPFEMRPRPGSVTMTVEMAERLLADEDRFRYFASRQPNPEEWMAGYRGNPNKLCDWFRTLPDGLRAYCRQSAEAISEEYRMLCFSKLRDNILMWSHYGG